MTLQQKTLHKYRSYFPSEPLRVTSARTGIQITRVFRLFNGKTMKVGELEAFEKLINQKILDNPGHQSFQQVMDDASATLSHKELNQITDYIERKIRARNFGQPRINNRIESASIA